MKILLVSHSQKIGGAEKCLIELSHELVRKSYHVTVILPSRAENYKDFLNTGCEIIVANYTWWVTHTSVNKSCYFWVRKILSHTKSLFTFNRLISYVKPDYIISNTIVVPYAAVIAKLKNISHFWFLHEFGEKDHDLVFDFGIEFSTKLIGRTSSKVFVNSQVILDYYSNYINQSKLMLVDINVPITELSISDIKVLSRNLELFIIGQFQPQKAQMDGILAHEILLNRGIDSTLFLIGNTTNTDYVRTLHEYIDSKLIKNVIFIEQLSNPFSLIKDNGIGLVCSNNEAFGRVTVEFMKLQIPIVAKASGNNVNLIVDGMNGCLYIPDNINMLVDKILSISSDSRRRHEFTKSAYLQVKDRFDGESFVNPIINCF